LGAADFLWAALSAVLKKNRRMLLKIHTIIEKIDLISIEDLAKLFDLERSSYEVQLSEVQPNRRMIFAENLEPHLTKEYPSVIKTAAALNCSPAKLSQRLSFRPIVPKSVEVYRNKQKNKHRVRIRLKADSEILFYPVMTQFCVLGRYCLCSTNLSNNGH
jgi:hypothetical protein